MPDHTPSEIYEELASLQARIEAGDDDISLDDRIMDLQGELLFAPEQKDA